MEEQIILKLSTAGITEICSSDHRLIGENLS